ncbi:MAG: GH36-type glycosyl hydrolase domain-containing protein [Cellulomonas sp.]
MTASTHAGVLTGARTRIELTAAGDVRAIRHGDATLVSQYLTTAHDAMVGGVFLRRRTRAGTIESAALVGGRADGTFTVDDRAARWSGHTLGARYTVTLTLDPAGVLWVWRVDLSAEPLDAVDPTRDDATYDVVLAQDLALAPEAISTSNEPYVSQYVVHHVIDDPRAGAVVASRQTMATAPALPLALTAVVEGAHAYLTDGFSFYGLDAKLDGHARALDDASWESVTYQYEFAMPSLLGGSFDLTAPRTVHAVTAFVPDYRGELGDALSAVPDLLDRAVALAATTAPVAAPVTPAEAGPHATGGDEPAAPAVRTSSVRSLLVSARLLAGRDLTTDELVGLTAADQVLRPETGPDGVLVSYFTPDATHVVSRAKELQVERPHGHVLKAGSDVTPNANIFSTTAYAYGVFASHVVVGNTSANRFVSVQRNHLNLLRSSGVRVLARVDDAWRLLGVPSALVMDLGGLHWVYATDAGRIDVRTTVRSDARGLEVRVDSSDPLDLLVTVDVELGEGRWSATRELDGRALAFTADGGTDVAAHCPGLAYVLATPTGRLGDDAVLFPDARARDTSVVTIEFDAVTSASVVLTGDLEGHAGALEVAREGIEHPLDVEAELAAHRAYVTDFTRHLQVDGDGRLAELNLLLPWFTQNALVHFLVPHGLEQYSGAAWGTRDVCQGPLELNLAFGHLDTVRDIVLRVFAHQLVDGTLPQWFMFDEYSERYQDDAHGDVVVWPLMALGEYLAASGDTAVLDTAVPFWDHAHRRAGTVPIPVAEHVRRSLDHIRSHRAPGTRLLSYGQGDWDDTLQPAQSSMSEEMASAWTVALLYQATRTLEGLLRGTAHDDLAAELGAEADTIRAEFTDRFVIDGVLAGYVVFAPEGSWPVIHPSDDRTGLHYRLIPMTRSIIAGLFTPEEALRHEALVEQHLHFPDGVRLMDRPAPFHDGTTRFFRRGEQAANFGREVGLMYTHAHIRYTQALATLGRERLVTELLRISPVGQHDRLATSEPRQRNCYYSSSDAAFTDRYDAAAHFDRLRDGTVGVKGGWRVYSSGPGIYLRQVVQGALGIVERAGAVVFDPVLALEDDGTTIRIDLGGVHRTVRYRVEAGDSPVRVEVGGRALPGVEVPARYRHGGLRIDVAELGTDPGAVIDVRVGVDRSTLTA